MRKGIIVAATVLTLSAGIGVGVVHLLNGLFPSPIATCPQDGQVVMEDDVKLQLEADHDSGRWMVECTIDRNH